MIESADAGSNCLGLEFSLYTDTGFVSNQKTGNLLDIVQVMQWILATITAVWVAEKYPTTTTTWIAALTWAVYYYYFCDYRIKWILATINSVWVFAWAAWLRNEAH